MYKLKLGLKTLLLFSFVAVFCVCSSCSSSKTGCPINEQAQVRTNKKGELPTSRGKSSIFPKKVKKSVGVK